MSILPDVKAKHVLSSHSPPCACNSYIVYVYDFYNERSDKMRSEQARVLACA